jgi:hypothetical protein
MFIGQKEEIILRGSIIFSKKEIKSKALAGIA